MMEIDGFLGEVLEPGDAGYEAARQIWNGDIQRRPAVVARCTGAGDVLAAVRFALQREMAVAVRGGGHAVAGHALCEGGLVIDLSLMTGTRVDPLGGTIRAKGGCLWRHVDHEAQAFGMAVTGGIVTHTGIHPLGPAVLAGVLAWPTEQAVEVLQLYRHFVANAPDEVGIMANLRLAPALPLFPAELHGHPIVALIVCYAGPVDEGLQVLRPLREFKNPAIDTMGPKPYVAHQGLFDAAYPHGRHYYWKAWKLPPLTDAAIDVIIEQGSTITSPLSAVPIFTLGGAVGRVDDDATAFAGRSAAHDINFVASWLPDDPEPAHHKAWARAAWEAMRPFSHGVYVNFLSDEPSAHVRAAYGDDKYERLVALKSKCDPSNFFRFNQNIAPRS